MRILVAFIVASACSGAHAFADYRCTIDRLVMLSHHGKTAEYWQERFKGKQFTVERKTGIMAGALKNSFTTRPQVIDSGRNGNAYKVVTTMRLEQGAGVGTSVYVLQVNGHATAASKPFVFFDSGDVFYGRCVHF